MGGDHDARDAEEGVVLLRGLGGEHVHARRRAFGAMSAMEGWASTDAEAAKAHELMESSQHIGKILLTTGFTG